MTRRTLITRVLSAFAGCVLARTPLAGKSWEPPLNERLSRMDHLLCIGGPFDGKTRSVPRHQQELRFSYKDDFRYRRYIRRFVDGDHVLVYDVDMVRDCGEWINDPYTGRY